MKRGEIWLINLDPTIGAEISKRRPALLINEDGLGKLPLRIVAPITAAKPAFADNEWMVFVNSDDVSGLDKDSYIDCFQSRSLDEKRMISRLGCLSEKQLDEVEKALVKVLAIDF